MRRAIGWAIGCVGLCGGAVTSLPAQTPNRGVYPLGMSATASGVTPRPGFSYSNQLLFYSRDRAKDDSGDTVPVTGRQSVLMDMNTFAWVSRKTVLDGAVFSAAATLPFAKNNLTSDIQGTSDGGSGFADSYYMPLILGWNRERMAIRAIYGFLAPTGRFVPGESDNVGSGYWTHALSSGQTFSLDRDKRLVLSLFQMYEFHSRQEGTGVQPGDTFNLDYSLTYSLPAPKDTPLAVGAAGYLQRQTTAASGSASASESAERYAVNACGIAFTATFPKQKAGMAFKVFKEFANRSTFEGYSIQGLGSVHF